MTNRLTTRALGAAFAASLLLGAAACGDDDDTVDPTEEPDIDEGLGGTENEDTGIDAGEGLGGTDDDDDVGDLGDPNDAGEEVEE